MPATLYIPPSQVLDRHPPIILCCAVCAAAPPSSLSPADELATQEQEMLVQSAGMAGVAPVSLILGVRFVW